MDLRTLGLADIELLDHVAPGVFDNSVDPSYAHDFLSNPDNVLVVAMESDLIIGMATGTIYAHPDKARQMFINEVGVDDAFQGRGVGKALMAAILTEGRLRGAGEAWVATEVDNEAANALYRSTGGVMEPERCVVYTYEIQPLMEGGP